MSNKEMGEYIITDVLVASSPHSCGMPLIDSLMGGEKSVSTSKDRSASGSIPELLRQRLARYNPDMELPGDAPPRWLLNLSQKILSNTPRSCADVIPLFP